MISRPGCAGDYDRRMHRATKNCWYCDCKVKSGLGHVPNAPRDLRTREHLIPKSNGGTSHPSNIRTSCLQCNTFVSDRPLEFKLKFRAFIRECGGWKGIQQKFGSKKKVGRKSWNRQVTEAVNAIEPPQDYESVAVKESLL